ncbi:MAG: hypothetical protein GY929_04435 [Actinomycetia bacterium]|nr:hypothetical protein [Actinomycetes bacterium]
MSLVARHLEEAGLPTVVIGAGRDIVEHCGVPRFLFTDFPLGNPVGRPGDAVMQKQCVEMALELLEHAFSPRTTVQTPFVWGDDHGWRDQYMLIDDANRAELSRLGAERRADQAAAKTDGRARQA